jgi:capsule synthesis protein PGA_cap
VIRRAAPAAAALLCLAAPAQAVGDVSIGWVGDMSFSRKHGLPRDPGGIFGPVRGYLDGLSLMTGNLEGTLGRGGPSKCGGGRPNCHTFQAPASYAGVYRRAGFDMMNLANNHSRDFGTSGQRQTQDALTGAGIAFTGLPAQVTIVEKGDRRIAFLGFAPYAHASSLLDIGAARKQVAGAARRADIVVVMMHAGAEGSGALHVPHGREHAFGENRGETRRFARTMVDAGADAVLGSGPHVLRGIECRRGRPIAYSLGNFASYRTLGTSGVLALSGVLRLRLDKHGKLVAGVLRAVRLTRAGLPRPDPKGEAIGLVRRLTRQDFPRTGCRVGSDGSVRLPKQ